MTPFTSAKMAELTPIATARVRIAMRVKPGVLSNCRKANRKSCNIASEMRLAGLSDSGVFRPLQVVIPIRRTERDLAIAIVVP